MSEINESSRLVTLANKPKTVDSNVSYIVIVFFVCLITLSIVVTLSLHSSPTTKFKVNSVVPSTDSSTQWTLVKLDLSIYPNAVCLDGSPAGFWFLKGSGSGANKFVIHHQGFFHSCHV